MDSKFLKKLSFLWTTEAVVGIVFIIAAAIIIREGVIKLRELWQQAAPFFPLSLPPDLPNKIQNSLPLIFSSFVTGLASICAVLIGISWMFSGITEIFRARKKPRNMQELDNPEIIAQSLQSGQAHYWQTYSRVIRVIGSLWTRLRLVSPTSYGIIRRIVRSSLKLLLLGVAVGLIIYSLQMFPLLLRKYANIDLKFFVPSPFPLYFLIGLSIVVNILIILSLIPFRKTSYSKSCETVPVVGRGDPRMFFALFEEGAKLLNAKGRPSLRPIRLHADNDPKNKGTLVESSPEFKHSASKPTAYLILPVIFFPLVIGFMRLIHFRRPTDPIHLVDFAKMYLLDYLMEVAFAIGLILMGLYFAEWARAMFNVRRFKSAMIMCSTRHHEELDKKANHNQEQQQRGIGKWKLEADENDPFIDWAKDPEQKRCFLLEVCWASALTESQGTESPRSLIKLEKSSSLDEALWRILRLPFCVDFETEGPVCPRLEEKSK